MTARPRPSNNQVDRAGERLREWLKGSGGDEEFDSPEMVSSLLVLGDFRADFLEPLDAVTNVLQKIVRDAIGRGDVTHRLKRVRSILLKLLFEPTMSSLRWRMWPAAVRC